MQYEQKNAAFERIDFPCAQTKFTLCAFHLFVAKCKTEGRKKHWKGVFLQYNWQTDESKTLARMLKSYIAFLEWLEISA